LIELLVVIAIIAILSAIIFPVYSKAKDSAFRNGDMASMNQLRTALGLYFNDQGAYPPQLLGYVTLYQSGPNMGQVIPADQLQSYLYKKRVGALKTFTPAYNRYGYADTTTAVYPNQDPAAIGTAPVMDLDGDGDTDAADDIPEARQQFGPNDGCVRLGGGVVPCTSPPDPLAAQFYKLSGYDAAEVPVPGGLTRFELRYTLFWTEFAISQNGNASDDPRQLGYGLPPDDTMITWNSYYRDLDSNQVPRKNRREIILFLGGSARPADANAVYNKSWRYVVNP
jgi:type II secretory pathway pseudopilin PulG